MSDGAELDDRTSRFHGAVERGRAALLTAATEGAAR
jgi:hypothetical protein